MSRYRSLEKRLNALEDDESESNDGVPFPASKYTAEDFQKGNFNPTDPYTPFSSQEAETHLEMFPEDDRSPAEVVEDSLELAIDRVENPEDYSLPGEETLTEADKRALDRAFDVTPATAPESERENGRAADGD